MNTHLSPGVHLHLALVLGGVGVCRSRGKKCVFESYTLSMFLIFSRQRFHQSFGDESLLQFLCTSEPETTVS